ncbi:transmembrane protein 163 isoform X3 [Desmodus rotundus]|uniref:transmembrane protein 163 isoform X3 n=1 Tax=Desmodus rotundus TaxID=9430 RepID=UPI0023816DE3|nr:transmembrane protein 163 isoform X3 [Desmodus rotundus]
METAAGRERRSPPGPGVPPPPRGHAPLAAAPGQLGSSAREPPQPEEGQQMRISQSGQFSDGLEDRGLLESSTRLKPHEAQNYRRKALWVSWFSIIVTLALAVAAFTVSVMRYSASAFGFAFDAILDVLSSAIVLWRYSNAAAVHSAHREYIACVILGVIFLLSSVCIVVKAIHDLSTKLLPEVVYLLHHPVLAEWPYMLHFNSGEFGGCVPWERRRGAEAEERPGPSGHRQRCSPWHVTHWFACKGEVRT